MVGYSPAVAVVEQPAVNVVCLKWGSKYSAEYVNRLFHMVRVHLQRPHRFYCLTENADGLHPVICPLPLDTRAGLNGWWYKLCLFQKDFFGLKGQLLYLDLDLVIVRDIGFLCDQPGRLVIIRNWSRNRMWNSSVMRFQVGAHPEIWQRFEADSQRVMRDFNGDQEWIYHCEPAAENWPGDKIVSYKKSLDSRAFPLLEKLGAARLGLRAPAAMDTPLPQQAAIVVFHGKPDPEDVAHQPYGLWKRASFVARSWNCGEPMA